MGNDITCTIQRTATTEQPQHYHPRNIVCFGYITVNIVHKGGGGDDTAVRVKVTSLSQL